MHIVITLVLSSRTISSMTLTRMIVRGFVVVPQPRCPLLAVSVPSFLQNCSNLKVGFEAKRTLEGSTVMRILVVGVKRPNPAPATT
jgi:hypothetical protein